MIRVLILGEVVGIPTVKEIKKNLKKIIQEEKIDFTIANCDGASDGYGILADTAYQLHNAGIDVLTGGDYIFNKKDIKEFLGKFPRILRPYNLPKETVGRGFMIVQLENGKKIGVMNLLGRTNFSKIFANDPFYVIDSAIEKIKESTNVIVVDFHGGTTSEVQAMQWYLKGKVSTVFGSHLRVLTTDNRVIGDYTGVVTGIGYCGGYYSVGGLSTETEIKKIRSGQFIYSKVASENIVLQGVIAEIDEESGKTLNISLFEKKLF